MRERHPLLILTTLAALGGAGCGGDAGRNEPTPAASVTVADVGFRTPESVLHDPIADVYLVSNVNGPRLAKDGNGFVSRVAPDGSVIDLTWIDGADAGVTLHAPKGMAVRGDSLFVADIDVLRIFDRRDGSSAGAWPVPDATFLNDVAVSREGTVYATDSGLRSGPGRRDPVGTGAVYRFEADGTAVPLVSGHGLGRPNGIVVHDGRVIIVTLGSGQLILVDDESGTISGLPAPPAGALDGIVVTRDGIYLVSSWEGQAVYGLTGGVTYETVVDSVAAPADIGYDAGRHRVLVPLFNDDRLEIRTLQ
jgi:sugar lactone lactonase YvrE